MYHSLTNVFAGPPQHVDAYSCQNNEIQVILSKCLRRYVGYTPLPEAIVGEVCLIDNIGLDSQIKL